MKILTDPPTHEHPFHLPQHITFRAFSEAWAWMLASLRLISEDNRKVYASAIWQDRFERYRPRDLQSKVLGFGRKAVRDCERLAPGGTWTVHSQPHHDGFQFQFSYSKYLPYAYAMVNAEDGYRAFGLDFECINGLFKTCMGFVEIGHGVFEGADQSDLDLYDELYTTACEVLHPSLPFDEAYYPAMCFLHVRRPDIFRRLRKPGSMNWNQVQQVMVQCADRLPKLLAAA